MSNINPQSPPISADFSQAIYYGALELLGEFELKKILKKVGNLDAEISGLFFHHLPASDFKEIPNVLIAHYGLLTAQGICLRIGRVTFQYLRRNNPEIFNNPVEERMLSLDRRINNNLTKLIQWLQMNLACKFRMEMENENWIITMNYPEECLLEGNNPGHYFFIGIFQECLEWMDGHQRYKVEMPPDSKNDHRSYRFFISYSSIS